MSDCSHCGAGLPQGSLFCPACGAPAIVPDLDELLASSASDPTGLLDRLRAATEGEFVIMRELGRGGMGRVYLAHETALERRVALKVLPPHLTEHSEVVHRFQREARTAGKLAHPHIVHVYQVLERGGLHFFIMPYVAGPNLRQVLKRTPQLDVETSLRYLCEAADALAFAHSRGVVHRDIKPENMLLEGSQDGRLLLTDFGVAKPLESVSTITRPGDRMGTPYYMSPEQYEEREAIDGRSDQYSLGMVAYEMLAGRFPFTAESLAAMAYKHVHEFPEPLAAHRPDVPEEYRLVIERAYRKDPAERYPTMATMLEALQALKSGGRVRRSTVGLGRASRRWRRVGWLAGASLAAATIGVIGLSLWPSGGRPPGRAASDALTVVDSLRGADASTAGFDVAAVPSDSGALDSPLPVRVTGEEPALRGEAGRRDPEIPVLAAPETPAELQEARLQAGQARLEAEAARRFALEQGADTLLPSAFADLEERLHASIAALDDGQVVAAAIGFDAVRRGFVDLSSRLPARLADFRGGAETPDEAASGDSSAPDPPVDKENAGDERPRAGTPEDAIGFLVESYRVAFEGEDLDGLRRDVYQGALPVEDEEFLALLFESAEGFEAAIEVEALTLDGSDAVALVRQAMRYQLSVTHEPRSHELLLRMIFARDGSDWRLVRLERR